MAWRVVRRVPGKESQTTEITVVWVKTGAFRYATVPDSLAIQAQQMVDSNDIASPLKGNSALLEAYSQLVAGYLGFSVDKF